MLGHETQDESVERQSKRDGDTVWLIAEKWLVQLLRCELFVIVGTAWTPVGGEKSRGKQLLVRARLVAFAEGPDVDTTSSGDGLRTAVLSWIGQLSCRSSSGARGVQHCAVHIRHKRRLLVGYVPVHVNGVA